MAKNKQETMFQDDIPQTTQESLPHKSQETQDFAKILPKSANCEFEHIIDVLARQERFQFKMIPPVSGQKIALETEKDLDYIDYLTMTNNQLYNPIEQFSAFKIFCKSLKMKKTVIEDY